MELTAEQYTQRATKIHGENKEEWEFICCGCKRVQSIKSIREEQAKGIESKRYGALEKGDAVNPETACYGPKCDWVANGLFHSGILVILDPDKEHNPNLKNNCIYVFPLAGDKEMEEEAL